MKRSEIKLSIEERIRILRAQATQLLGRNHKEVVEKRMQKVTANKEWLALQECVELAEALNRRGLEWKDLIRIIEQDDDRYNRVPVQGKIIFH